jgi:hypothetical protein
LTSKLYPKIFKREAEKQKNQTSVKFITDYKNRLSNLYIDPIAGLLFGKRDIEIHRTDVPVQGKFQ